MRRLFIACVALCCCGFTIVTADMIKARAKLCDQIRSRYGEKVLSVFLGEVIRDHAVVEGAKLSDSKVGRRWLTMDWNPFWHIISDDWAMAVKADDKSNEDFDRFTMFWKCDEKHGIFIGGHRDKAGRLVLDSIRREEVVEINWL